MNTFNKVYDLVSQIPKGKITTYKEISKIIGTDPRIVGFALHANKNAASVPCHRVINYKGKISSGYAFGGADTQKKLLINEGVKFLDENTIDLKKALYKLTS